MIKEQYRSTVIDTTLNIINSRIESVRSKNITKTSQRVYKDNYIGVAGAIGSYSEQELFNEAQDALIKKIEYPIEPTCNHKLSIDKRQQIIDSADFVKEFIIFLEELTKRHPNFIFSNKISLSERISDLSNDANLNLFYADRSLSAGIIFKEKSSTNVFDGPLAFSERKYNRKLALDEFSLILNAYNEKVALPKNGRHPVIFLGEDTPVEKFITDLKADVFSQGGSLFSGKVGECLFNESFTFGQKLDPEEVLNTPFFDTEGTINPGFTFNLIENGVIKAPYCDKKTAHKYGYTPSGSASSAYDGIPQTAFLNAYIEKTNKNLKTLLGGQIGILVLMAAGGDFTPQGDYATPVQLAFLCDGDRIIGRLPELNLSSNVYDMFGQGFRGVTKDTFLPFSTNEMAVLEMNIAET